MLYDLSPGYKGQHKPQKGLKLMITGLSQSWDGFHLICTHFLLKFQPCFQGLVLPLPDQKRWGGRMKSTSDSCWLLLSMGQLSARWSGPLHLWLWLLTPKGIWICNLWFGEAQQRGKAEVTGKEQRARPPSSGNVSHMACTEVRVPIHHLMKNMEALWLYVAVSLHSHQLSYSTTLGLAEQPVSPDTSPSVLSSTSFLKDRWKLFLWLSAIVPLSIHSSRNQWFMPTIAPHLLAHANGW